MDGRSWSPSNAVRKDDQFTAAPDFIDHHDSDHLPMWGRLQASWHGMAPRRQVMVASSVLVLTGLLVVAVLGLVAQVGSPPASQGPVAIQEGDGPLPSLEVPAPSGASDALNATSSAPPLPSLPVPSPVGP